MKIRCFIIVFGALVLASCARKEDQKGIISTQENLVNATIWFQRSPEMKALYYQGYNLAKLRLAEFVKQKTAKQKAVVVDIDETMLDNSPFEAQQIVESSGYTPESWKKWSSLAKAKALPGAVEFSHFCDSLGVEVMYISNRKTDEVESTLKNLDSLGFSFARKENMIFKEDVSSKKNRRDKVSEKFEIVMLIGDNLNDLSEVFEKRGVDWGTSIVEQNKKEFGNRFIVLPNPMYGDWEKNIYGSGESLTVEQRRELRLKAIYGI
jgi:5'-nucleotidase (lipoprotein e(P4) family)